MNITGKNVTHIILKALDMYIVNAYKSVIADSRI